MQPQEDNLSDVARLFGRLLLHEVDEGMRAELCAPELSAALSSVGVDTGLLVEADLDQLAAEFLEAFLQPAEGGPLVQSLWTQGNYEADCAVTVRKLAEAAGVDFDRQAARGAPQDHLGCILLLWAEVREPATAVAERLEQEHLAWALAPLARIAAGEGFYAGVARAVGAFLRELTAEKAVG